LYSTTIQIVRSKFENCIALRKGGVIYYKKDLDSLNDVRFELSDTISFLSNYAHESAAVMHMDSTYMNAELNDVSAKKNKAKFANSFAEIRGNGKNGGLKIESSLIHENKVLKGDSALTLYNMNA